MDDFPTATSMRAVAVGKTSASVTGLLQKARREIESAAAAGHTYTSVDAGSASSEAAEEVVALLVERGFAASYYDDQREGSSITVRW